MKKTTSAYSPPLVFNRSINPSGEIDLKEAFNDEKI